MVYTSKLITLEELADLSNKIKARFESVEGDVAENTASIQNFDTLINLHSAQISQLQTSINSMQTQIESINNSVATMSEFLSELNGENE